MAGVTGGGSPEARQKSCLLGGRLTAVAKALQVLPPIADFDGMASPPHILVCLCAVLASVGVASAEPIEVPTFDPIFQNDSAVRMVVSRIGLPDYAEVVPLDVGSPWIGYELRAYYLVSNRMLVFMRADLDEGVSVLRYQGPIPPAARAAVAPAGTYAVAGAPVASGAVAMDPDQQAAEAEAKAAAAERAAERAEDIAREMESKFQQSLAKN